MEPPLLTFEPNLQLLQVNVDARGKEEELEYQESSRINISRNIHLRFLWLLLIFLRKKE